MATKLSTVADALVAQLNADRASLTPAQAAVGHDVGAEHLHTSEPSPPYLVFVRAPKVEHLAGGKRQGPQTLTELDGDGDPFKERQIYTRRHIVSIHVWETTEDLAEVLVLQLIDAAHTRFLGSHRWLGEEWPMDQEHDHLQRGEPVVMRFEIDTPVPGIRQPTVTIESHGGDTFDIVEEI